MCLTEAKEDDVVGADKAICFVRLGQGSRLSLNVASRKIKIKTRLFPLPFHTSPSHFPYPAVSYFAALQMFSTYVKLSMFIYLKVPLLFGLCVCVRVCECGCLALQPMPEDYGSC